MPQMNKGGKWVFGWCLVGASGEIRIPPEAYTEYGFQAGEPVVYLCGSHRSGGFSVGRLEKLNGTARLLMRRSIGQGIIHQEGWITIPPKAGIRVGQPLLAVRGSGLALLFLIRGPICEEAHQRPEIETFSPPVKEHR